MRLEKEDIETIIEPITQRVIEVLKPLISNSKQEDDVVFDVAKLAEYLNVNRSWVYKKIQFKEIPYLKVGKYSRFRKKDIDKWLSTCNVPAVNAFTRRP